MTLDDANKTKAAFLLELDALCQKHHITISHEDSQGAFQLEHLTCDGEGSGLDGATDLRVTCPVGRLIHPGCDFLEEGRCYVHKLPPQQQPCPALDNLIEKLRS